MKWTIWLNIVWLNRYSYSDDGSEEFDKEDTLTLIKPSPVSTKEVTELRLVHSDDGDLEEDKTQ